MLFEKNHLRACVPACLLGLLFLVASCSSEEVSPEVTQDGQNHFSPLENRAYLTTDLAEDTLLSAVAKIAAVMQQEPEFRSFMVEQLVDRQTREQSVLYIAHQNREIKAGLTLSALMEQSASGLGYQFEPDFFSSQLAKHLPRLSFTVYLSNDEMTVEQWDYATPIPIVAETEQFSTGEAYYATAYLPEGKQPIHNQDDPTFDAMVIENNRSFFLLSAEPSEAEIEDVIWQHWQSAPCGEFVDQVLQVTRGVESSSMLIYQDQHVSLLEGSRLVEPLNQCAVLAVEDKHEPVVNPAERDNRTGRERIVMVRVHDPHLKEFCKWWRSSCNVKTESHIAEVSGATASLGQSLSWIISGDRKDDFKDENVYGCNVNTFIWRYLEGQHGDPYAQSFIGKHHNPGSTTTYNLSFTPTVKVKDPNTGLEASYSIVTAGLTRQTTTSDYDLGSQLIYYHEDINPWKFYNTGSSIFDFWISKLH